MSAGFGESNLRFFEVVFNEIRGFLRFFATKFDVFLRFFCEKFSLVHLLENSHFGPKFTHKILKKLEKKLTLSTERFDAFQDFDVT